MKLRLNRFGVNDMYIGIIDFLRHEIAFYDIEKLRLSKNICVCAGEIWKRWGGGYNLGKYNIGLIEDRTIKEKAMVTYEEALKLTIEAVWEIRMLDQAITSELMIKPMEDGSFQYLSNKVISSDQNANEGWYMPRLTEEEWEENYSNN